MTGLGGKGRPSGFIGFLFGNQADYVRRLTPLFGLCLGLYIFSMIAGFYTKGSITQEIIEAMLGMLPELEKLDITTFFLFILFNNVLSSFIWMVLGIVGSIPPIFFIILNGFYLGNISYSVAIERGMAFTAAALIPHGIIETPTILLSSAAGMGLGYAMVNSLRGRGSIRLELSRMFRLFTSRIIPLLLVAAVFEVTITPMMIVFLGFS
jgi:stage II sporulation protein M